MDVATPVLTRSLHFRYNFDKSLKLYRLGTVKHSPHTSAKEIPSCVLTFLSIFDAPLQSALINFPLAVRYSPLLILFPRLLTPFGFFTEFR